MGREGGSKVLCRSIVSPCSTECTRVSLVFMSEQAGIDGNSNRTVFEEVSFVPTQHSSPYLRHRSSLTIDPHLRDFFFPFFDFQFENLSSSRFDCLDPLVNFNDFNPLYSYSSNYLYYYSSSQLNHYEFEIKLSTFLEEYNSNDFGVFWGMVKRDWMRMIKRILA